MNLIWNDLARVEFIEATTHYDLIDVELGERFVLAVEAAVAKVKASPLMFNAFIGEVRKVRLETFPYAVIYFAGRREYPHRSDDASTSRTGLLARPPRMTRIAPSIHPHHHKHPT